jgi:hypothetical protein
MAAGFLKVAFMAVRIRWDANTDILLIKMFGKGSRTNKKVSKETRE